MKKTKLISVLVGGALTVGLAVGLAGCGNSNSSNGNQTSKSTSSKKVAEKKTFTIKEMNKYIKFVPNDVTKDSYSGILADKSWGKIVVDSPYKDINGTVIKLSKDEIPQNGEITLYSLGGPDEGSGEGFADVANDYFTDKHVKLVDSHQEDSYAGDLKVNITGIKNPQTLNWKPFLNQFNFGGRKPNLITMGPDGFVQIAYVDNNGYNFAHEDGRRISVKDGQIKSDLTKGDISSLNDEYTMNTNGGSDEQPKDLKSIVGELTSNSDDEDELTSFVLYNGTNLK